MTEEPYRWLEAIANRREYVRDQLKGGTPVFAASRPEGVLLFGVGHGHSKIFEIYDRHAFAALGHPVDIEKLRQSAIETAHLEGFNRSAKDVTLRRLVSFALSTSLKNSFEQIFSPPLMVESIFAELGGEPREDVLVRLHFDGNHHYATTGVVVAHADDKAEKEAQTWLEASIQPGDNLARVLTICVAAWQTLMDEKPFTNLPMPTDLCLAIPGKTLEVALLDRAAEGHVRHRQIDPATLAG